jgi:Domain of unknown function (DUF4389)
MYPVAYSVQHEEEGRNRLTVFFRLILAIPWVIFAAIWGLAVFFTLIASWFALLFTGRYPEGLYEFHSNFLRFMARVHGWTYLLVDEFPPFNGSPDDAYPVRVAIAPALDSYSRAKVFFRLILMIPVYILAYIMSIIVELVAIVAWFVLVFVAKLPEGLYKPMRAANAYLVKAGSFYLLLTEDFPPFWVDEAEEAPAFGGAAPAPTSTPPPPPAAA